MARLFADENFPLPVVDELWRPGHDTLTVEDPGLAGQSVPDDAILDTATVLRRAVLTPNRRHVVRLHGERPHHAGIVVCTFDLDFVGQAARRIDDLLRTTDRLDGLLLRVNRPGPM
jgi:Domain of unknown function (DUF5615)